MNGIRKAAAFAALLWAVFALVGGGITLVDRTEEPVAKPPVTTYKTPGGLDETQLAKEFATDVNELGFRPGEVTVGQVNWDANPVDHRVGAFGEQVRSQEDMTVFLASDTEKGRAARQHQLLSVPESERARILDGDVYVPVQFNTDIKYAGNSYWMDGKLVEGGEVTAKAGDVFWVPVGKDYEIYWEAAVRADCKNPGLKVRPRPHRHPTPHPHPTPTPTTPHECVEIPGNGKLECNPKSSDKEDYRRPGDSGEGQDVGEGDKPRVTVDTPAEDDPPEVDTDDEDADGDEPGDESGGSAPGADSSDSDDGDDPPAEGGDDDSGEDTNDGSAGDAP